MPCGCPSDCTTVNVKPLEAVFHDPGEYWLVDNSAGKRIKVTATVPKDPPTLPSSFESVSAPAPMVRTCRGRGGEGRAAEEEGWLETSTSKRIAGVQKGGETTSRSRKKKKNKGKGGDGRTRFEDDTAAAHSAAEAAEAVMDDPVPTVETIGSHEGIKKSGTSHEDKEEDRKGEGGGGTVSARSVQMIASRDGEPLDPMERKRFEEAGAFGQVTLSYHKGFEPTTLEIGIAPGRGALVVCELDRAERVTHEVVCRRLPGARHEEEGGQAAMDMMAAGAGGKARVMAKTRVERTPASVSAGESASERDTEAVEPDAFVAGRLGPGRLRGYQFLLRQDGTYSFVYRDDANSGLTVVVRSSAGTALPGLKAEPSEIQTDPARDGLVNGMPADRNGEGAAQYRLPVEDNVDPYVMERNEDVGIAEDIGDNEGDEEKRRENRTSEGSGCLGELEKSSEACGAATDGTVQVTATPPVDTSTTSSCRGGGYNPRSPRTQVQGFHQGDNTSFMSSERWCGGVQGEQSGNEGSFVQQRAHVKKSKRKQQNKAKIERAEAAKAVVVAAVAAAAAAEAEAEAEAAAALGMVATTERDEAALQDAVVTEPPTASGATRDVPTVVWSDKDTAVATISSGARMADEAALADGAAKLPTTHAETERYQDITTSSPAVANTTTVTTTTARPLERAEIPAGFDRCSVSLDADGVAARPTGPEHTASRWSIARKNSRSECSGWYDGRSASPGTQTDYPRTGDKSSRHGRQSRADSGPLALGQNNTSRIPTQAEGWDVSANRSTWSDEGYAIRPLARLAVSGRDPAAPRVGGEGPRLHTRPGVPHGASQGVPPRRLGGAPAAVYTQPQEMPGAGCGRVDGSPPRVHDGGCELIPKGSDGSTLLPTTAPVEVKAGTAVVNAYPKHCHYGSQNQTLGHAVSSQYPTRSLEVARVPLGARPKATAAGAGVPPVVVRNTAKANNSFRHPHSLPRRGAASPTGCTNEEERGHLKDRWPVVDVSCPLPRSENLATDLVSMPAGSRDATTAGKHKKKKGSKAGRKARAAVAATTAVKSAARTRLDACGPVASSEQGSSKSPTAELVATAGEDSKLCAVVTAHEDQDIFFGDFVSPATTAAFTRGGGQQKQQDTSGAPVSISSPPSSEVRTIYDRGLGDEERETEQGGVVAVGHHNHEETLVEGMVESQMEADNVRSTSGDDIIPTTGEPHRHDRVTTATPTTVASTAAAAAGPTRGMEAETPYVVLAQNSNTPPQPRWGNFSTKVSHEERARRSQELKGELDGVLSQPPRAGGNGVKGGSAGRGKPSPFPEASRLDSGGYLVPEAKGDRLPPPSTFEIAETARMMRCYHSMMKRLSTSGHDTPLPNGHVPRIYDLTAS